MRTTLAFIRTLRLHQWTKNLLVFAALVFSRNMGNTVLLSKTALAFLAFCFLSSSVYVINDLLDRERDKAHPVKRHRPIASGRLKTWAAIPGAALLIVLAGVLAFWAQGDGAFLAVLAGYFALNLAYSTVLKKVVVADVMSVAIGFLLRVTAGGLVIDVETSHWLILCTFFAAVMLASCKRRAELSNVKDSNEARAVLADYSFSFLDIFIAISASSALMTYALYTVSERTVLHFHTTDLIYTVPAVMYGIGRYLFLVYQRNAGEDPAAVLVRDVGMIAAIAIWFSIALIVLYGIA
jgi:4-hydroxybenzoate polyprenyltransferase